MRTNLPTTLLIAGLALLSTVCETSASSKNALADRAESTYAKGSAQKTLAEIQQAAKNCASMEWAATMMKHGDSAQWKETYPISAEEAEIIRDLLLNKLHTVKFGSPKIHAALLPRYYTLSLLFKNEKGETIYEFKYRNGDVHLGKDSETDANGYQILSSFSLPDADYETWQKLHPAEMKEHLAKWRKGSCKK